MRLIKIGMANIDTTVGDFTGNTKQAIEDAKKMVAEKCSVGCFQEQVISGYPPEDLVQWKKYVTNQWEALDRFREATSLHHFATVFIVGLTVGLEGHLFNSVAIVCRGKILGIVPKEKLPSYGVFDETRIFSHGAEGSLNEFKGIPFGDMVFKLPFGKMAVEVCEDLWSTDGPMKRRAYSGAELIINASASPWRAGIVRTRKEIINTRSSDNQVTLVYVNQVGGNDALVFDGGAYVSQNGRMVHDAPRWKSGISYCTVDLDRTSRLRHENTTWRSDCEVQFRKWSEEPTSSGSKPHEVKSKEGPWANQSEYKYPIPENKSFFIPSDKPEPCPINDYFDDLVEAMVMGLDGYFRKTKAFKCIGISQSGGKDSGLTTVIAWLFAKRFLADDAQIIRNFVHCFSQPTGFNTDETKSIARELSIELGLSFSEVPIEEAFEREIAATKKMRKLDKLDDLTLQNIQARIRGQRMWNWSNSASGLWLQTGNMSEKAVGYTTIGGDMMGGYSLIANLPKTVVIELLRYLGEKYDIRAIKRMMETEASAELKEDQSDEDDLMPFPVLDACFALFAGEKMSPKEVYFVLCEMFREDFETQQLKEWVLKFSKLFTASIYKWVQTPQTVHLGTLDLDRERALQLPVVQSRDWLGLEELEPTE